jgi:ABC-type multidrug transport system fused ATPase/permease subunit
MKTIFREYKVILTKSQFIQLILLLLGLIFCSAMDALVVGLMAPFLNIMLDTSAIADYHLLQVIQDKLQLTSMKQFLVLFALSIALIYLIRGVFRYFLQRFQANRIAKSRAALSKRLFRSVLNKPYQFHVQNSTAKTQRLLMADVNSTFTLLDSILSTLSSLFVIISVFIVLFTTDAVITIVAIVFFSCSLYISNKIIRQRVLSAAKTNRAANTQMNKWVQQSIGGIKDILAKRRQEYAVGRYDALSQEAAEAQRSFASLNALPKFFIETVNMIAIFGLAAGAIGFSENVATILPSFATFALAGTRLIPLFGQLSNTIGQVNFNSIGLHAVYEALYGYGDRYDSVVSSTKSEITDHAILSDGIKVNNISFRFEENAPLLFSDTSLIIPRGAAVGLIGPSGAGKTTLADIILGLQVPTKGEVCADGIDIHRFPNWWANMVGYVPQNIYLCDDTIRANVAFGIDDKDIDDELVWKCLEKAQMKEFILDLPDGLLTYTGENGIRLSGGQRQRIGIALYTNPQVLIMDEATSALDHDTEQAIIEAVNALSGEKTLLIIAHRLTTIKNCSIVYKVDNGVITIT